MGTRPIIYKYPLDRTGRNPNNLIVGEPHTLPSGNNRPFVPNYGAFFTESIVVRDASTGTVLTPNVHYKAVQLYQDATEYTGKEICSVIVVTDPAVGSDVEFDYQVIGGEYSTSVRAVREMVHDLDLDARPVAWGDLLGKPKAFPPGPHLHDAGDVYGYEFLVEAIERIRLAILVGNEPVLQELRQYIVLLEDEINARLMPAATLEEALEGRDDRVITPKVLLQVLAAQIDPADLLASHLTATNPHDTTLEGVGLMINGVSDQGLITVKQAADTITY